MANERGTYSIERHSSGARQFNAVCRRLGIRENLCVKITHFANDVVIAIFQDPQSPYLRLRTVIWLKPPGAPRGC